MTEKRYKRIHINTTNFIVFDKQEGIKGNLDECSFEDEEVIDLLNEKEEKIKQLKCKLNYYEHKFASFNQEKENLQSMIENRIKTINQSKEAQEVRALYELEYILDIIKNEENIQKKNNGCIKIIE